MKINLPKISSVILSLFVLLSTSSCNLSDYILTYNSLTFNVLSKKGDASLSLYGYFSDEKLKFTDDESLIFNSFKGDDSNNEVFYPIIICDTLHGFDACEEYGEYAYYGTITRGNQRLISLNGDNYNVDSLKIIANNKNGTLGQTIENVSLFDQSKYTVEYTDLNDLAFYNSIFNGEYKDSKYNFAFIAEPYATRLLTNPDSAIFIGGDYYFEDKYSFIEKENKLEDDFKDYIYPYRNLDKFEYNYSSYNLSWFYSNTEHDNSYRQLGIPQTSVFVHKDFYQNNLDAVKDFLENYYDNVISISCVECISNTRPSFKKLSKDQNEDTDLNKTAYTTQFNKVGISWKEAALLQFWHELYGESMPHFNGWPNGLQYSKTLNNYYTTEYIKEYFNFINRSIPNDEFFIK